MSIDYTTFPLGVEIQRDVENDKWAIHNTFDKDIRVTVVLKPGYWLTLPYGLLLENNEPKIFVERAE